MVRAVRLVHVPSREGGPSHLAWCAGRLAVDDDGCVFAASVGEGPDMALAWPLDYTAHVTGDDIVEIIGGNGEVVLREGDHFGAAGGLGPATADTMHALSAHSRETFFIGMSVERLER